MSKKLSKIWKDINDELRNLDKDDPDFDEKFAQLEIRRDAYEEMTIQNMEPGDTDSEHSEIIEFDNDDLFNSLLFHSSTEFLKNICENYELYIRNVPIALPLELIIEEIRKRYGNNNNNIFRQ